MSVNIGAKPLRGDLVWLEPLTADHVGPGSPRLPTLAIIGR
jgi:hypothetical protein